MAAQIIGWVITTPIYDSDGKLFAPPRVIEVVSSSFVNGYTMYLTNAWVKDYDSDPGYRLTVIETIVETFISNEQSKH